MLRLKSHSDVIDRLQSIEVAYTPAELPAYENHLKGDESKRNRTGFLCLLGWTKRNLAFSVSKPHVVINCDCIAGGYPLDVCADRPEVEGNLACVCICFPSAKV